MTVRMRISPGLHTAARYAAQIAILIGVVWVGYQLAGSGMFGTLWNASPVLLAASLGAATTAHAMAAGRWWSLAPAGHGYVRLARIQIESHFWATLVPGGVAADGYRVFALHRRGTDAHHAAASVVVERALGAVVLLILCGPALALGADWLTSQLFFSLTALASLLFVLIAAGTVTALWAPVRRGHLRWLPSKLLAACTQLEDAFAGYRTRPGGLARAFGFAVAYHALFLAAYALAGEALGVRLGITGWLIAVPLASLAATLPVNAWGIGVREGAVVLLLIALGASPAQAGAVAIVIVGLQLALSCSGGISQLLRRHAPAR